jgi:SAM-dependent methyltransferase
VDIPLLQGRLPQAGDGEFAELRTYASGRADADARNVAGDQAANPWPAVLRAFEPALEPAAARLFADPVLSARIAGTVVDVGAGTCYLTGHLSQRAGVERVYAVDLSAEFLRTTGRRMIDHVGGDPSKVTFVATDFNAIPLDDGAADAAFIFAALHHSLAPIKTLQEVARIVRPGGAIFILENPVAVRKIAASRQWALALSASSGVTEISYTRAELEYLLAISRIGSWTTHRWDVLSRPGPRRWLRHIVRAVGLEDVLINPPTYLFEVTRA